MSPDGRSAFRDEKQPTEWGAGDRSSVIRPLSSDKGNTMIKIQSLALAAIVSLSFGAPDIANAKGFKGPAIVRGSSG